MRNTVKSILKIVLSILLVAGSFSYASDNFVTAEGESPAPTVTTEETIETTTDTPTEETIETQTEVTTEMPTEVPTDNLTEIPTEVPSATPTATPEIINTPSSTPETTSSIDTTFIPTASAPAITNGPSASAEIIVYEDVELSDLLKEYYELKEDEDASALIKHTIYVDQEGNSYFYGFIVGHEEETLGFYLVDLETKEFKKAEGFVATEEELIALLSEPEISLMSAADPDNLYVAAAPLGNDTTGDGSVANPYETIGQAYAEASASATIHVMTDLTYDSLQFNDSKAITLTSCDASGVDATTPGEAHTLTDTSTGTGLNITAGELTTSFITFDGNKDGGHTNSVYPVYLNGTNAKWNLNEYTIIQDYQNNSTSNGGIILVRNGELNANGATIQNNSVPNQASAGIYLIGSATGGNITNCTFKNNTSKQYGALTSTTASLNLNVTGSTFEDNTNVGGGTSSNGAAIFVNAGANLTINESTFTGNTADYAGGAVYSGGSTDVLIQKSTFTNNSVVNLSGGAIYSVGGATITTTIQECTINGNSSGTGGNGGAVAQNNGNGTLNIIDSNFANNNAPKNNGGAAWSAGTINITSTAGKTSTWDQNTTTTGAGAAAYAKTLIVNAADPNGVSFTNNTSASHGGALYATGASASFTNASFTGNKTTASGTNGGAVYCANTADFLNCNFTQNTTVASGGAIRASNTTTITGSTFNGNIAGANGGAVIQSATSATVLTTITDSSFTSNSSTTGNGGAVYTNAASQLVINNTTGNKVTFDQNVTNKGAGGAVFAGGPLSLVALNFGDIIFTNNNSTSHAGALYTNNGTTNIEKISFVNNKTTGAGANGGAVYNNNLVDYTDCKFDNNESVASGGAIYLTGNSMNVTNCEFTNNNAGENGGAIGSYNYKSAVITNSIFDSNTAANYAGALYMDLITLTDSTITNNTARVGGGYVGGNSTQTSVISGSTISNNTAGQNGGGIYTNGITNITDSTIGNNKATLGAGIFTHTNSSYKAVINLGQDAKVTSNTSSGGGAGVYVYGGTTLNMTDNSSITNNFATIGDGGGIYQANNGFTTMKDTASITGNHCAANKNSGGVYNINGTDGSFKVQDNVVIDNNYYGTGSASIYAANYYINNTATAKNTYDIALTGALGDNAHISVMTRTNMKDILIAKAASGYQITDSDLAKFSHDRITRGNLDGMPIVFDSDGSTGSTNNLELYASQYKEIHIYDGVADPAESFVGLPGAEANIEHYEPQYGFTIDHVSEQSTTTGNVEQTVATGGKVIIPDDDSLIIRYYNTRNNYTVKFAMEDPSIGTLSGSADQTVAYNSYAVAGATATANDPVNYYFTGWKYQVETEYGTVFGNVMDYTSIPVTGDVTFIATFAKVPFVEIDTPIHGSVSIINGTTPKPITDNTVYDRYEWPDDEVPPYEGVGAFKANPNYKVKSIIVNDFHGAITSIPLTNGSSISIAGGTATLTIDANGTYGDVQLSGLTRSAQITVEFEKLPTVQVIYHSNGGTPDPLETREIALGNTVGIKPTSDPTRDEYRLVGWSTDPNAVFDEYNADYLVTQADITAGTIDYYAVWDANTENEYDILVYFQTGVDGSNNPIYTLSDEDSYLRATAEAGTTVYAYNPANPGPKEVTGYTWNPTALHTLTSGQVAPPEEPRLVLRLYYDTNQYKLTYHENGGTAVSGSNPKDVYYKDVLPTVTTTYEGFTFEGWYKEEGFINKVILGTDTMPANDLDLYARWVVDDYDINYVLNGGTNNENNPDSYVYGVGVTFQDPTKDHYDFEGWYTEAGFVNQITGISATDTGDKTVYAKWSPTEYDITYILNGGTVAVANPTTYNVETPSFTLHNATKTGYTFDGWTGTGVPTESKVVTISQGSFGDRTYTANFTPFSYSVSFDANGGTGTAMANQSFTYDTAQNLSTNTYTKTGYTFGGWATSASGSAVYDDEQNVNNLTTTNNATIPLYATWVAATDTAYKVEHYKQELDGSYPTTASETQNKTGTTLGTADATPQSYTGFTQNTSKTTYEDASTTASGTVLTISADGSLVIKLYYDRNKNDISYSATIPGGCSATVPTTETDVLYGANKTVASDLSCAGYTFSGWTTTDATVSSGSFDMPNNDVEFTGTFTENTITITYQADTHGSVSPTSENVLASTGTATGSTADPDTGYKFKNWTKGSTQVGTTAAFTPSKDATSGVYETATYVAHFEPISYSVSFDPNGGTGGPMTNESFDYDEEKALTTNVYTKTGYTFAGWDTNAAGTNVVYDDAESVENLSSTDGATVPLYAVWTENSNYTVEYETNGGTTVADKTGVSWTQTGLTPDTNPTKTGYTFDDWYTDSTLTTAYANDTYGSIAGTDTTTSITLYAGWTENSNYTVEYETNGGTTVADKTGVSWTQTGLTPATNPTKTGYTFDDWYTDSTLTTAYANDTYGSIAGTDTTMSIKLYAGWTENQVTITYTKNNTHGNIDETSETIGAVTGNPTGSTATADTGYKFTGWTSGGSTVGAAAHYTPTKNTTSGLFETATYTANFTPISYSVSFDANGGTGTAMANQSFTYDAAQNLSTNTYTKTGYTFAGWDTDAAGTTVVYGDAESVENLSSTDGATVPLYAVWTANNDTAYTVEHYQQDATGSGYTIVTADTQNKTGTTAGTADATPNSYTGFTQNTSKTTYEDNSTTASGTVLTISADGSLIIKLYYDRNTHDITYSSSIPSGCSATVPSGATGVRYGASETVESDLSCTGYTFNGWTTSDATVTSGAFDMPDKAVAFTGTWSPNTDTAYTVEHYQQDVTGSGYTIVTADTESKEGTTATTATFSNKTYAGFTYVSSKTTYEDTDHTTPQPGALTIAADGSLVIKLYYDRNKNDISYSATIPNGCSATVPATETDVLYGASKTVASDLSCTGYTFSWSTNDATVSSGSFDMPDNDVAFTGTFTPINYEVIFNKTVTTATGTMSNESFAYDEQKALTANAFTLTGYTFAGWDTNAAGTNVVYTNNESVKNLSSMDADQVNLYAVWTANNDTAYTVEHYQQNVSDNGYTIVTADTESKEGTTATAATFSNKTYAGFTYDSSKTTYQDSDNAASTAVLSIAADGSLVIRLYYDRNTHDITYSSSIPSGCTATNPAQELGVKFGASKTVEAAISCDGYSFSGWTTTDATVTAGAFTMPDNDVAFTGTWTANTGTAYKVEHYQQNLNDNNYTRFEVEDKSGVTDTAADATNKTYTGFTYNGALTTYEKTGTPASTNVLTIAGDGSLIIKLYYTRNTHDITYQYTGTIPTGAPTKPADSSAKYGAAITVAANPTLSGYSFSGWDKSNFNMPDEDVTISGYWTENEVTITYNTNNTHGSVDNTSETIGAVTGDPTGSTATPATGYKFVDWTKNSTQVGTALTFVPSKDATSGLYETATYTANFTPITYSVSFDANGGTGGPMANESFDYDAEKALTTNVYTKTGYTFGGWATSSTGSKIYDDAQSVKNLSDTDGAVVNLFAIWTPRDDTRYIVEHYKANVGGTYPATASETENKTGTTASTPDLTPKTYTGYTLNASSTTYEDTTHTTPQTGALTIAADGSLIVRLYYDRNVYTITYDTNGGTNDPNNPANYTYGDTVTFVDPTYAGHTFEGWFTDASFTTPITNVSATDATNLTLFAKWSNMPTPTPATPIPATPNPGTPDPGRTCQDDGYPAGWYWNGSACVAPGGTGTPTPSTRPYVSPNVTTGPSTSPSTSVIPSVNPSTDPSTNPSAQTTSNPNSSSSPSTGIVSTITPDASSSSVTPVIGGTVIVNGKEYTVVGQNEEGLWIIEDADGNDYVLAQPKFGYENNHWALINLIAAVIALLLGIVHLIKKSTKDEDQEDEDGNPILDENGEVKTTTYKRHKLFKLLTCIIGIAAVIVFILTENLRTPMVLVDKWTVLMIIILIVGLLSFILGNRWKEKDDEDQTVQG